MTSLGQTTGIVLAGGRSTRFGADKLAIEVDGVPLLHRPVLVLAEVCDDVVVVLAPGGSATLPPGVRVTHDPTEGEGPLAGLQQGLLAAVRSDAVVVAGGDMPDLQPAVLRSMLTVLDESGTDAVALHDGVRERPLPLVLRTWPAADATHALLHAGRRALRDILQALRTAEIDEPVWAALDPAHRSLRDIDEPADLDGPA
jgi:molybdopterin-guanine dinucleotide biosynthesis protein A